MTLATVTCRCRRRRSSYEEVGYEHGSVRPAVCRRAAPPRGSLCPSLVPSPTHTLSPAGPLSHTAREQQTCHHGTAACHLHHNNAAVAKKNHQMGLEAACWYKQLDTGSFPARHRWQLCASPASTTAPTLQHLQASVQCSHTNTNLSSLSVWQI